MNSNVQQDGVFVSTLSSWELITELVGTSGTAEADFTLALVLVKIQHLPFHNSTPLVAPLARRRAIWRFSTKPGLDLVDLLGHGSQITKKKVDSKVPTRATRFPILKCLLNP